MYVDTGEGAGQPLGMTVSPDKLVRLIEGIESERDRLQSWLFDNSIELGGNLSPPGNDPCSRDIVSVFAENGHDAVKKAHSYVSQLSTMIDELRACARDYGLIEDENTDNFRQEIE